MAVSINAEGAAEGDGKNTHSCARTRIYIIFELPYISANNKLTNSYTHPYRLSSAVHTHTHTHITMEAGGYSVLDGWFDFKPV